MKFEIKDLSVQHFPELLKLFQEFATFEKTPEKMINTVDRMKREQDFINGFIAFNGHGAIIAYATYFFAYHTWVGKCIYMDDLYVTQPVRGHGLGSELIARTVQTGKNNHCREMRWQVSRWNEPAIAFYQKLGAVIDDVEMNCKLVL